MSSSVNEFQAFMINDSQLKSTGQVNLFTINSDKYGGKPNRLALVLVIIVKISGDIQTIRQISK